MVRYGMLIDLKRCICCHSCTIACKAENFTPPGILWGRVREEESGVYPTPTRIFLPVLCNHCKEPPCRDICPTGATTKRDDGIVLIDYDKCIGCKACMAACPYGARYYMDKERYYYPAGPTPYELFGYSRYQIGVTQKCTFCSERIDKGLEPACVVTCPTNARIFGNLDDPKSNVSQIMKERLGIQLLAELGTDPSVFYIQ